jgi:hypothetical protein
MILWIGGQTPTLYVLAAPSSGVSVECIGGALPHRMFMRLSGTPKSLIYAMPRLEYPEGLRLASARS